MKLHHRQPRIRFLCVAASCLLGISGWAQSSRDKTAVIAPDFLNQVVKSDQSLHLTLPDGRQIIGKIDQIQRFSGGIAKVQGQIQHPEPGEFSFERQHHHGTPGPLQGTVKFASKATQWKIEPDGDGFKFAEMPVDDAFRPRAMVMPTADQIRKQPGMSREEAEASLRKDLKIEKTADGKLRLGVVEMDPQSRAIHFPAVVNMTSGTVEYALVTTTGKSHEAMFTTQAAPRDIHLAMLLLGVQPAKFSLSPDKGLIVPATAALDVSIAWETNGPQKNLPLAALTTVADASADKPASQLKEDRPWLYNGSRFNEAGFAATLEGSIISLIADEMALVNNSQSDRDNDEIHLPNSAALPPSGTQVTITFRQSTSFSAQKPKP